MASTYSKDFEVYIAKQFKDSFSASSGIYLTFGRSRPWPNENNPPQANTSDASFDEVWKDMVGGKKINGNDVRHVLPRHDWTSNTVYVAYDNLTDSRQLKSANSQFYVITDEFNVYKCIANNYGQPSTYKPTSTNPSSQFQTADKYVWKYMYSLTGEEQLRFTTKDFFPVRTLLADDNSLQWQVQEGAIAGAIHNILIQNTGVGYTSNNISVVINGDGFFANAYAVRNVFTDQIDSIVVDNKGSGYTYANVKINSLLGNGAIVRAIISPPGGHGSDALYELGGSYLIINPQLDGTEGGILVTENDYRRIAIISDPYVYGTSNVSSNQAFSQLTTISLAQSSSVVDYILDEVVYQGTNLANATYKGVVIGWDSANSLIKLNNVEGLVSSALLSGNTSSASRYVSAITDPDLEPYSGYVLYKDNLVAIERATDQTEDFKIVLSF